MTIGSLERAFNCSRPTAWAALRNGYDLPKQCGRHFAASVIAPSSRFGLFFAALGSIHMLSNWLCAFFEGEQNSFIRPSKSRIHDRNQTPHRIAPISKSLPLSKLPLFYRRPIRGSSESGYKTKRLVSEEKNLTDCQITNAE
jgi:hypothetical protein